MNLSGNQLQQLRVEFGNRREKAIADLIQAHRDGTATEAFLRSRAAVLAELKWLLDDITHKADSQARESLVTTPERP